MSNLGYSGPGEPGIDASEDVDAGDLVRTGSNEYPYFEVLAVRGDKAWVRDVQSGAEQIVPRARCRRITPSTH